MLIAILIILLVVTYILVRASLNLSFVVRQFQRNNVVVFGKKGSGKDMLFQQVINARKKFHYSNINYHTKTLPIIMNDISLFPNTYEDMINGKITKLKPNLTERYDIYISDAGVMLPSQYDWLLHKKYPSLPLLYALQRHLYASNMHVNVQALSRVWKPIRELADGYIQCEKTIWIGPIYIQLITYYDRYNSAEQSLLPIKRRIINGHSDALADQYIATNGLIKPMFLIGTKKHITYDTRYFRSVFFLTPDGQQDAIASVGAASVNDKQETDSVGSITHRD
jgi:hypothetical protein